MDDIFEYLEKIAPNGLMFDCFTLDWELIKKFTLYWLKTGKDQFEEFYGLSLNLMQVNFETKNIRIPNDLIISLKPLFEGKYIFDIEDVLSKEHCEIIKILYEKKTNPQTVKLNRRLKACKITSMKTVREAVLKKDGGRCRYCGSQVDLTVDHILPVDQGGKDKFSNFQTLCRKCNSSKSNKIIEH